jgi:predicted metal-dependent hydrolase
LLAVGLLQGGYGAADSDEAQDVTPEEVEAQVASSSSTGRLTFNYDLLRESSNFRMEVIVHELLHLKVPNHGKVFRALLKAYLAER